MTSRTMRLRLGSPPRTRGKLASRRSGRAAHRLTPANAGKTAAAGWSCRRRSAHPRERGENQAARMWTRCWIGSPPRTRGKQAAARRMVLHARLTPANAGKTRLALPLPAAQQAHPRERGENPGLALSKAIALGSPPRTRGKLCFSAQRLQR